MDTTIDGVNMDLSRRNTEDVRKLRKLKAKKDRYESHSEFLEMCLEKSVVPKGFRLKWNLSLGVTEDDMTTVRQILDDASVKLMRESVQLCNKIIGSIKEIEVSQVHNLCKKLTNEQFEKVTVELDKNSDILKNKLKRNKKKKMNVLLNGPATLSGAPSVAESNDQMEEEVAIIGDGNCFYRCLASVLLNDQSRHVVIRNDIAKELEENPELYGEFVDGKYEDHVANVRKSDGSIDSWATESEVIAATHKFETDIFVYNSTNKQWVKFPMGDCEHRKPFICVNYQSNHFNLIKRKARPCRCEVVKKGECKTEAGRRNNHKDSTDSSVIRHGPKIDAEKEVINLSSKKLSESQESLLRKGLKFVPTRRRIDVNRLITDLQLWERRMRLREYFHDKEESNQYSQRVGKSSWTPSEGRDKWLDQYIREVKDDVISGLRKNFKMNITTAEEEALRDLLSDSDIVIRPADKGSGIVILDSKHYVDEVKKEMRENGKYTEVSTDMTQKTANKIKKLADGMFKEGAINAETRKYLIPSDPKPGKLQGNPKIHKTNNPMRTIVNSRDHPTEAMAEIVEAQLTDNVKSLPSYIRDTTDFIKKISDIPQPLPSNTILFCMDVKALYPNVPRKEARVSVEGALEKRKDKSIPPKSVLKMMDMVLENNNFCFDDKHYLQMEGTAIGSRLGMNYASTYLGDWERQLLEVSDKIPLSYFRFVDDIWGLWTHGIDELKKFQSIANNIHPNIHVDLRYSTEGLEFLDVFTSIKEGKLVTDLYSKPSDKHLYLHYQSSHPGSTKRAIPYGLGVRIKRICSEPGDYVRRRQEICGHLAKRGYSKKVVTDQFSRVDKLKRSDLLEDKERRKVNERVPLALVYSRALPDVRKILRRKQKTLHQSDRMKEVFPDVPIVAFRRDSNIQDILVHKKHNAIFFSKPNKCEPCRKSCALCPYLQDTNIFRDNNGTVYHVRNYVNCKSSNVVYAIFCKKCDKFVYVGETGDTLYQRQLLNFSLIRRKKEDPVALHFNSTGHRLEHFRVVGLEKLYSDDIYRKNREVLWKKKLRTYKPYGINTKE